MVEIILFLEIMLFAACALWRERFFFQKKKFIFERILLITSTIFYLIIKLPMTESIFTNLNHYKAIESGILGLIYILNFNLLVGLIMKTSQFNEKIVRTQKRLMYKLPLVGFLLGITFYNYIGFMSLSIFLFGLLVIYLGCHGMFFKRIAIDKYILVFILLNILSIGLRFLGIASSLSIFEGIDDCLMAISILMILESYHQRLKTYV